MLKSIRTLILPILLSLLTSYSLFAGDYSDKKLDSPEVISIANKLPHEGTVCITHKPDDYGYVYFSVDKGFWQNDIINALKSYLHSTYPNYKMPEVDSNDVGPHISLAYTDEYKNNPDAWEKLNGKKFKFDIDGLYQYKVHKNDETRYWYVLQIKSKDLTDSVKAIDPSNDEADSLHISIAKYETTNNSSNCNYI